MVQVPWMYFAHQSVNFSDVAKETSSEAPRTCRPSGLCLEPALVNLSPSGMTRPDASARRCDLGSYQRLASSTRRVVSPDEVTISNSDTGAKSRAQAQPWLDEDDE